MRIFKIFAIFFVSFFSSVIPSDEGVVSLVIPSEERVEGSVAFYPKPISSERSESSNLAKSRVRFLDSLRSLEIEQPQNHLDPSTRSSLGMTGETTPSSLGMTKETILSSLRKTKGSTRSSLGKTEGMTNSKNCLPSTDYKFQGYTFLNTNIVNTEATYAPYFLRFDDLYTSYDSVSKIQVDENLREWNERFCNFFKPQELHTVIYKTSVTEIKMLRNAANSVGYNLPRILKNNFFAEHLIQEKCLEVIHYLIFAKECEPHVIPAKGWKTPKRNTVKMVEMIERGRKEFRQTNSHYVRLRYAYQIIRLAHYAKEYELVLTLLDDLMPKVHAHPSLIDYWILGHKAGALQKLKKNVEAAYLYSRIFANCPSKRQSAYQSFHVKNDEEWQSLLLMCKSDEERAVLYTMRANHDESKLAEEMEKIYELDPGNENLELLLVKEIKKLEKDLLGTAFNDNRLLNSRYYKIPRKQAGKYLLNLRNFVEKCVEEKQVLNLDLWKIAYGYLTYLGGDYYDAAKIFQDIEAQLPAKKELLKEQLNVFQLALKISSYENEIDNEDENEIGNIIRENKLYWKYKDFPDFLNDKLSDIYFKMDAKGKAYRIHHTLAQLKMNPDLEIINDLLKICQKKEKSSLEKVFVKKTNVTTIENDLRDLRATLLFNNGEIEAALEMYKQIPRNEREPDKKYNPFHENIIDCIHCPIADTLFYDRAGVIQEILGLEYKGGANLGSGAVYFYQLGNAYYNMTYFGNSWQLRDYDRGYNNWYYANPQHVYPDPDSDLGNQEYMDFERARHYYNTALELAKEPELLARVHFMLAKCDLNDFYIDPNTKYQYDRRTQLIPTLPEEYFTHYKSLIEEYSGTEFYKFLIEECQFFKAYALK